jgi:hypothetical protein
LFTITTVQKAFICSTISDPLLGGGKDVSGTGGTVKIEDSELIKWRPALIARETAAPEWCIPSTGRPRVR